MEDLIRQVSEAGGPLKLSPNDKEWLKEDGVEWLVTYPGGLIYALDPGGLQSETCDTLAGVLRRYLVGRGYAIMHNHLYGPDDPECHIASAFRSSVYMSDEDAVGSNALEAMLKLWLAVKEAGSGS